MVALTYSCKLLFSPNFFQEEMHENKMPNDEEKMGKQTYAFFLKYFSHYLFYHH